MRILEILVVPPFKDQRPESHMVHTSLPEMHQLQNHRVDEDFSQARMKINQETKYSKVFDQGKSPHH